jgi:hypothetical protein
MGYWEARAHDGRWSWQPKPLSRDERRLFDRFRELGERFRQGTLGPEEFVEASECLQPLLIARLAADYDALSVQEQIDVSMAFCAIMDELLMLDTGDLPASESDRLDEQSVLEEALRILRGNR